LNGVVAPPEAVLVLGMHRSGTSATAGALAKLGFSLGDDLVPPAEDNPGGYFEHAGVVAFSDDLLAALGSSWDDVRALPAGWTRSAAAAQVAATLRERLLPALRAQRPWALKDPRMCRLLPLWRAAFDDAGARVACLLVLRHPDEVAASLHARDGMPPLHAHLLWLRHVLESARASQGMARAVLPYPELLAAPAAALARAGEALGLPLPLLPQEAGLEAFVDRNARHHAPADAGDQGADPWRSLALDVHAAMTGDGDPWRDVEVLAGAFEAACGEHARWIEAAGAASAAAEARRRRLDARHVERQARTDAALESAGRLAHERLDALRAAREQQSRTDAALASAERLAHERLGELDALRVQLERTDAGLSSAQALALQRLSELQELSARLDAANGQLAATSERLAAIESSRAWRAWRAFARAFPWLAARMR